MMPGMHQNDVIVFGWARAVSSKTLTIRSSIRLQQPPRPAAANDTCKTKTSPATDSPKQIQGSTETDIDRLYRSATR
jgi:hypothetical protein